MSEKTFLPILNELGIDLDAQLFELAVTHRSYAYEAGGIANNERLEFLGDAILGMVVAADLYRTYPDVPEGRLAKLRAAVVNTHALADVAREVGIGDLIRLGVGEKRDHGEQKSSILADTTESIIGAIYLDAGLDAAERFIHTLFRPKIADAVAQGAGIDWKTSLQELCAELGLCAPTYRVSSSGPDHAREFTAVVAIGDDDYGPGQSTTKRHAEQTAARRAYDLLSQ